MAPVLDFLPHIPELVPEGGAAADGTRIRN
jgi:hypothetical protein